MYIVLCGVGRQVEVFHQKDCFSSRRRAPGAFTVQQQEEKEKEKEEEKEEEWGRLCGSLNFILLRNHRGGTFLPQDVHPSKLVRVEKYLKHFQIFF